VTIEETGKICAKVQINFPWAYKDSSPKMKALMVETWNDCFADFTYQQVSIGLNIYLHTNTTGYPPIPSQIIECITTTENMATERMTADEAWILVKKAIQDGAWHSKERFEELPPAVQKAVGGAESIRNWSQLSSEQNDTVTRALFIKSYNNILKEEDYFNALPRNIRERILAMRQRRKQYQQKTESIQEDVYDQIEGQKAVPIGTDVGQSNTESIDSRIKQLRQNLSIARSDQ
jgi:hypothetical protein